MTFTHSKPHSHHLFAAYLALAVMPGMATADQDLRLPDDTQKASVRRGGPVVSITVTAQIGDMPAGGGGMVTDLGHPTTDGNGKVGFTGNVDTGVADAFVWYDTGITFLTTSVMGSTLLGSDRTMGVSNAGDFIASLQLDGDDVVWTDDGLLAIENVQAPGFPAGTMSTFHDRPTLTTSGAAYWVAGFDDGASPVPNGTVLYTSADHQPGSISVVLRSDGLVEGIPIARFTGVRADYDLSDDGNHHIHGLFLDTGSLADDAVLYVDGTIVAREGSPTGVGGTWGEFNFMSINNDGDYVFTGRISGAPPGTARFLAYNGAIVIRENDVIDGLTLENAIVRGLSINNLGQVLHLWNFDGDEAMFIACNGADLAGSSRLVSRLGDSVDVDGDMVADAILTNFRAGFETQATDLADDGKIHLQVELDYGMGDVISNVVFDFPYCGPRVAINELRIDQGGSDDDEYFELTGPAATDLTGFTYLVIGDGPGGSGEIEAAIDLSGETIPADGFWLAAEDADTLGEVADLTTSLNFENSDNVTHLLVTGFTGAIGNDLDTNDDCVLDVVPWDFIVDGIALVEEANPPTGTECHYGAAIGVQIGPDGGNVPGHVGRDPDLDGPWILGDFDPLVGTDTPGASNVGTIPVELIRFSVD